MAAFPAVIALVLCPEPRLDWAGRRCLTDPDSLGEATA
jgi:hypothetical protein